MVEITIRRLPEGYTFLVNGRDDLVRDPRWGVATFASAEAARETAELVLRALAKGSSAP
jgi:hypothetical protein